MIEAQQNAETTTQSTAPVQESSAQGQSPVTESFQPSQQGAITTGAQDAAAAAAQAAIDYKFRYRDESAEKVEGEIDDWARSFLNKENEAKFKEIWAKAHGLEFVKNRFSKVRDEYTGYKSQVEPLLQGWNTLTELYNRDDMEGFFRGLQIPDDKIFKYVLAKLEYQQLPPEERAARDQRSQVVRQNIELERQNQALQQQYQQQTVSARTQQLDIAMTRPDVQTVASSFDQKIGRPGAFREEVIKRGVLAWHTAQQDITPEQAIAEVLQIIGTPAQTETQANSISATQPAQSGVTNQAQVATRQSPPVLPNVGAKNTSPTKRGPKSLDEIRKLAAQMG